MLCFSGFSMLLSGCPAGGSGPSTPTTVTAFHVPEQVTANSTFNVTVAVQSGSSTSGASQASGLVRGVYIADVTPSATPIDCGDEKPATVDGDVLTFSCTAPQAMPSGSNEHTLAVRVQNTSDAEEKASVEVVNDGVVDDTLTDTSGASVAQVTPGQTLMVTFSSSSNPAGVGQYTVIAPTGWTINGSAVCTLPGSSGSDCQVKLVVPANETLGVKDYVKLSAQSGSSRLENMYFPVDVVQSGTPSGGTPAGGLAFQYAENISDTVYANLPGQTPAFTYNVRYTFKNMSGGTVNVDSAATQGLSGVQYECAGTVSASAACALPGNGYLVVSGQLQNDLASDLDPTAAQRSMDVYVQLLDSGKAILAQHSNRIYLADYRPGYVAFHIVNPTRQPTIIGAFVGNSMIDFSTGKLVNGIDFKKYSYRMPVDGGTVYVPPGSGIKIYIAHTKNNFSFSAVPSSTGSPEEPPYVVTEMTYTENPPKGACQWGPTECPTLTVDESYVNSIAILARLNAIGNAGHQDAAGQPLITEDATFGAVTSLTTKQLFDTVQANLVQLGGPWAKLAETGTVAGKQVITRIEAPIAVSPVPSLDPFPAGYYDDYVDKLWTYYSTSANYMLVNASGVGDASGNIRPADDCIVKGQVATTGANAGKLVFQKYSGTCPQGYVVAGLTGMGAPGSNTCGPSKNQGCYDTTDLVFSRFNDCDFLQATGSGECHQYVDPTSGNANPQNVDAATFFVNDGLWGPNGTYRAVIGRAIAAYQAAGLLPAPSSTTAVPAQPCSPPQVMQKENAAAIVVLEITASGSLASTPCLSGLTIPSYNAYANALLPYVDVYTYSYSDFLGRDGTVTFSEQAYNGTTPLPPPLQRAQPVTVTLQ